MAEQTIVSLLAELLSGTQVPRSISKHMLGAGVESWDRLRVRLNLYGWVSPVEIEARLQSALRKELNAPADEKVWEPCPACEGEGVVGEDNTVAGPLSCPRCQGKGIV